MCGGWLRRPQRSNVRGELSRVGDLCFGGRDGVESVERSLSFQVGNGSSVGGQEMVAVALLFASGFTALTYEVLWVRQLGLVFGNTAISAATCLAVFFLGMSLGQWGASRRCTSLRRPLAAYGVLELLAAATTLGAIALPHLYVSLYSVLFDAMTHSALIGTVVRVVLSATVLLPPAIFLGATLPVMVEAEVRRSGALARSATALYAANTFGGVLGAIACSFWLAPALGFLATYLVVASVNVAVGLVAVVVGSRTPAPEGSAQPPRRGLALKPLPKLVWLAFASGVLALSMEVIWTRMLVQVLHNSVYSFAAVLAVMLLALGGGSALIHVLARSRYWHGESTLAGLVIGGAVTTGASAQVFNWWTDGLAYLGGAAEWGAYVNDVFLLAGVVMMVPGLLLGTVFPGVLVLSSRRGVAPGATVGWLVAVNTLGSVLGSLATGFLILPILGLWRSLQIVACAYALLAPFLMRRGWAVGASVVALGVVLGPLSPVNLGRVDIDPSRDVLVEVKDSAEGTVAVVRRGTMVSIKVNNSYTVGTNANIVNDRRKADLPLVLVPDPESVFFIGMGAGVTAAAALDHPVKTVTTCELVPAVARAAEQHLAEHTHKLFDDPRSRVLYGDGRNVLAATRESFDVIVGDLFVPWHAGVANLYTVEHFRTILDHLEDDGVFAQWLPLYQFTQGEFEIIARTMLDVFPLVTMWRGDLQANAPAVALFGHQSDQPLDLSVVLRNVRRRIGEHGSRDAVSEALMLLFYAGNLSQGRAAFDSSPVNTDDLPVIEYLAPIAQRRVKAGADDWLTGRRLVRLYRRTIELAPTQADRFLSNLSPPQRGYADAGLDLFDSFVHRAEGDAGAARDLFELFRGQAPPEVVAMFESMIGASPR